MTNSQTHDDTSKIKNKAVIFVYYNGHGGIDVDIEEEKEYTDDEK